MALEVFDVSVVWSALLAEIDVLRFLSDGLATQVAAGMGVCDVCVVQLVADLEVAQADTSSTKWKSTLPHSVTGEPLLLLWAGDKLV
jgi:hypothetical protein